jgi:hypothetical protein
MAICPFYREEMVARERRRTRREAESDRPPKTSAAWCAHLYSPVSKYVAILVVGGATRLKCGGDLDRCQVRPMHRPKT